MNPVLFRQRAAALASAIGPADPLIHTAIPPLHLGGGVDVQGFARPGGFAWVTAGLTDPTFPQVTSGAKYELALCTRERAEWAPRLLSRLGPHTARISLAVNGTVPLGDGPGRIGGLLFVPYDPPACEVEGASFGIRLAVAVTAEELAACRARGVPAVVAALEKAGVYPFSDPARPTEPGLAEPAASASPLRGRLSPGANEGFEAVVQASTDDVEGARDEVTPADLPILAQLYFQLSSWPQRIAFVLLTQDHHDPALEPVWRHALGMPRPGEGTEEHAALAAALAGLAGDFDAFPMYLDDLELALKRAAEAVGERGDAGDGGVLPS